MATYDNILMPTEEVVLRKHLNPGEVSEEDRDIILSLAAQQLIKLGMDEGRDHELIETAHTTSLGRSLLNPVKAQSTSTKRGLISRLFAQEATSTH